MKYDVAFLHGLVWAIMWGSSVTIMEIKWPHLFLHDYPKELQEVIALPPFNNKKPAYTFLTLSMILIVIFIFWSGVHTYSSVTVSYWVILGHIFIVCMCWNILDLIIMDWLIFCYIQPKFIILPGSEGNKAYKDYKFHFIGFLKGIIILAMGSIIIAGICYIILKYLIW